MNHFGRTLPLEAVTRSSPTHCTLALFNRLIERLVSEQQSFTLSLRRALFDQVKEYMAIVLKKPVTDEIAKEFLMRHPALLGSIIEYDEVDTEDRSKIWELCHSNFL